MGGTFEGHRVQRSFLKEQGYLKLRQDKGEDTDEEQTGKKKITMIKGMLYIP